MVMVRLLCGNGVMIVMVMVRLLCGDGVMMVVWCGDGEVSVW